MLKKYSLFIGYAFVILAFSIYMILDTLVITEVYETQTITANYDIDDTSAISPGKQVTTDNTYKDDNIEINIKEYRKYDTTIYVADIILNNAAYLKTAFANNTYGKNVTAKTSSIANSINAILAINGDYYGVQESGYVLKNGTIYRSKSVNKEDLVIYKDGSFEIINEKDVTASQLLEKEAYNVLSFGPALLVNNKIEVAENEEVARAKASNPRTAIGKIDDLHYVFVVSDGRTNESTGLSLYELATFMKELGIQTAYNLDGGGSSTMYFNGKIVNNPTSTGNKISERSVSDIVYIGY